MKYPKNPTNDEMVKIAKDLVVQVRNDKSDPYDAIRSTGFDTNLLTGLLKHFNAMNFLFDYEQSDGNSRDVGPEPLSLEKLIGGTDSESSECDHEDGDSSPASGSVTRIFVVPMSQARDVNELTRADFTKKEEAVKEEPKKENSGEKTASFDDFYNLPLSRVDAVIREIDRRMTEKAAEYVGHIKDWSSRLVHDRQTQIELCRIHRGSEVTEDLFKTASLEFLPENRRTWMVTGDEKVAADVTYLEGLLSEIKKDNEVKELFAKIRESRTNNDGRP